MNSRDIGKTPNFASYVALLLSNRKLVPGALAGSWPYSLGHLFSQDIGCDSAVQPDFRPLVWNTVRGFVVKIVRSLDGRVPNAWLAERDGSPCVVTEGRLARAFPTAEEARLAAEQYCDANRGRVASYVIRRT